MPRRTKRAELYSIRTGHAPQAATIAVVAYHEASHAVFHHHFGTLKLATIKPDGRSAGHVRHRSLLRCGDLEWNDTPRAKARIETLLLASLAGPFGQRRYAPRSRWRRRNNLGFYSSGADFDYVHDIVNRLHGGGETARRYMQYLEAWTDDLVSLWWDQIDHVAQLLLKQETLTAEEVRAAIYSVLMAKAKAAG